MEFCVFLLCRKTKILEVTILELYYNAKHIFREYKKRSVCSNAEIAGRALAARQGKAFEGLLERYFG